MGTRPLACLQYSCAFLMAQPLPPVQLSTLGSDSNINSFTSMYITKMGKTILPTSLGCHEVLRKLIKTKYLDESLPQITSPNTY